MCPTSLWHAVEAGAGTVGAEVGGTPAAGAEAEVISGAVVVAGPTEEEAAASVVREQVVAERLGATQGAPGALCTAGPWAGRGAQSRREGEASERADREEDPSFPIIVPPEEV